MKQCKHCGRVCKDSESFCGACGSKQFVSLPHREKPRASSDTVVFKSKHATAHSPTGHSRYTQGTARNEGKRARTALIIAVSVLIVVAAVVLFFVLRPGNKDKPRLDNVDEPRTESSDGPMSEYVDEMMVALRGGDKAKAAAIYQEHILGNQELEAEAQGVYRNWLASVMDDFKEELITYKEAQHQLDIAKHVALDPAAYQASEDYIESLHRAREMMQKAAKAYNDGDFIGAMASYREVLNDGRFFQDKAATGLESCIDMYRTHIADAVREQIEAGNREKAEKLLQEGLSNLPDDKFLLELRSDLQKPSPTTVQPTPVIEVEEWKEAYLKQLNRDAKGIKKLNDLVPKSAIGSGQKTVAIADLCGDDTPELIYVVHEDEVAKVLVWGYNNGLVSLLRATEVGLPGYGGGSVGIAGTKGGNLLIMHEFMIESFVRVSQRYEYSGGELTLAESLDYYEDYDLDDNVAREYFYNDQEINENEYKSKNDAWVAEIKLPLIAFTEFADDSNVGYKKFVGKNAMTYKEAIAFLNK